MDKQDLTQKWLSDQLTDAEMEVFKKQEDYQLDLDIVEGGQAIQSF